MKEGMHKFWLLIWIVKIYKIVFFLYQENNDKFKFGLFCHEGHYVQLVGWTNHVKG